MTRYGPCMCGATDCPSCGPAQGYEVVRVWDHRRHRFVWVNPDPQDELDPDELPEVTDSSWGEFESEGGHEA